MLAEFGLDISVWQRHRGHVRASIMKMGTHVCIMEEKGSLSEKDKAVVPWLGGLERLDEEHKKLQLEVLDLIKDDEDGAI